MDKIKIHWVYDDVDNKLGNALGYATHNRMMRKYCEPYIDFDKDAKIALHIVSGDWFRPIEGKFNVIFTMWEYDKLPPSYIEGCNKADFIIVPCRFCKDLFKKTIPNKPVEVCWEGIEPNTFKYYDRAKNYKEGNKFRFLWVGASNPRKGYPLVLEMIKVWENNPNVEIYIKTTMHKLKIMQLIRNIWKYKKYIFRFDTCGKSIKGAIMRMLRRIPNPNLSDRVQLFGKHKNIIMDTRKLSREELNDLYNSAHCFLLPTCGEGWGLTLTEAMATGCPSIATRVTGVEEYFDESVGYPIKYTMHEQDLMENYKIMANGAVADTKDLLEKMVFVMLRYSSALKKGKSASERIHSKFRWDLSAIRLAEILRGIKC